MKVTGNIKLMTVSQTNLAAALDLTTGRITQLIQEGVVIRDKKDKSGGVFLFDSLKTYFTGKAESTDGLNLREERARHEKVKREITELKLKKLDGSVYNARTVELVMIEQLVTLRTKLLGLPMKLAPQLEGKSKEEMYKIMTAEIEENLAELSEYKPELFKEEVEDNGADDEE